MIPSPRPLKRRVSTRLLFMAYTQSQIIQKVAQYAAQYGIDPDVGTEQIRTESGFNPRAYNAGTGASGLGQFIPGTWAQYGRGGDPFDVDANLDAWGRLMRDLLSQFGGDYAKALIAYHSGPGAVGGVLRNPSGNPKSTAYYQGILARAGRSTATAIPTNGTDASQPFNDAPDEGSGLFLPIAIGAVLLLLLFSD